MSTLISQATIVVFPLQRDKARPSALLQLYGIVSFAHFKVVEADHMHVCVGGIKSHCNKTFQSAPKLFFNSPSTISMYVCMYVCINNAYNESSSRRWSLANSLGWPWRQNKTGE